MGQTLIPELQPILGEMFFAHPTFALAFTLLSSQLQLAHFTHPTTSFSFVHVLVHNHRRNISRARWTSLKWNCRLAAKLIWHYLEKAAVNVFGVFPSCVLRLCILHTLNRMVGLLHMPIFKHFYCVQPTCLTPPFLFFSIFTILLFACRSLLSLSPLFSLCHTHTNTHMRYVWMPSHLSTTDSHTYFRFHIHACLRVQFRSLIRTPWRILPGWKGGMRVWKNIICIGQGSSRLAHTHIHMLVNWRVWKNRPFSESVISRSDKEYHHLWSGPSTGTHKLTHCVASKIWRVLFIKTQLLEPITWVILNSNEKIMDFKERMAN